jgi:hypothetical protein
MYNATMDRTGQALLLAGEALLSPNSVAELKFEGINDEFGQRLVDTMAVFGSSHVRCIDAPEQRLRFLQQVCMGTGAWKLGPTVPHSKDGV